ncbi:YiiD C-terminal domain-containing protein [Kangiella sp. TOML190]|uniref:YiiD C-terminal domain-containing protein n=1 Tax=Kangiella sp. TOML190 TaxID=2931351 RepID=UPI002040BA8B|nr:YiiD C-terminal domain-containing protein [Kangiella sp. TOML190]
MTPHELQQLLYQEIPITQAMAIEVQKLSKSDIEIKAPFEANKNIHQTAFAGSIYTTATLAGWSLLTNHLKQEGLKGSVVLGKAQINYLQPIKGDIIARTKLPSDEQLTLFEKQLNSKGRSKLKLLVEVIENEQVKASFEGAYAVL